MTTKRYYVYILESINFPDRFYTGFTEDLNARLAEHNQGKYKHTLKYLPWRIKTAIMFQIRKKLWNLKSILKVLRDVRLQKNDYDQMFLKSTLNPVPAMLSLNDIFIHLNFFRIILLK